MLDIMTNLGGINDASYDYMIINEYLDGEDYIPHHSDNPIGLQGNTGFVSLSIYDQHVEHRIFQYKSEAGEVINIPSLNGYGLLVSGEANIHGTHALLPQINFDHPRLGIILYSYG